MVPGRCNQSISSNQSLASRTARYFKATIVAASVSLVGGFTQAQSIDGTSEPAALALLSEVETALTEVSYAGIYTYEHTGFLDTIQISHSVNADGTQTQLEHLSGKIAEPLVQKACAMAFADHPGIFNAAALDKNYLFRDIGEDRVAGREVALLSAQPRDEYRYGYHLAIDAETRVPLMLSLINGKRMIERFQFVDFNPAQSQTPSLSDSTETCSGSQSEPRWSLQWLPSGFNLVSVKQDAATDMLTFSDGLSRFSVFVNQAAGGHTLEGEARRGGTLVYLDKVVVAGVLFQVSVVGEIPLATAQQLARSVVPSSP